ncbi:6-aminohexanoate hydrolase [Candidatus Heimdallarchaeota archaeon B3_Heim]|nr:MAG: 6-aminohexanoate hydrolase [Candidatus Heimdallarchaeota archaeon B3_Heim]
MKSRHCLLIIFSTLVIFFAAGGLNQTVAQESPDYWPTKVWRTSPLEKQGIDSKKLAEAIDYIMENDPNIHSMLVIRNGYIVTDAYFYPFAADAKHDIASVTKSITSTLIGIAIQKGYIKSVKQTVLDFFPGRKIANLDEEKKAITVEDLLTMKSGMKCINRPTEVTLGQMMGSPNWVQFMLDLPMTDKPGTHFVYNSGAVHLLSAIIHQASGMTTLEFAQNHLFNHLGITDVIWPTGPQGNNYGWGSVRIKPHAMAKLGYLYLQKGMWDGEKILSPEWVAAATSKPDEHMSENYGYLWWLIPTDVYFASGRGGQHIYVIPSKNMVVVFTGGGARLISKVLNTYIMPAVLQDTPLPANPESEALLLSKIRQAAQKPQTNPEPAKPLPEVAQMISGKTFTLEPNTLGLLGITLTFPEQNNAVLKIDMALDTDRSPEYKIGLDNVHRISPARFGIPAAGKGCWMSDNTFHIDINEIGNINRFRITLTFEGNMVSGKLEEFTGLGSVTIIGRLKEQ